MEGQPTYAKAGHAPPHTPNKKFKTTLYISTTFRPRFNHLMCGCCIPHDPIHRELAAAGGGLAGRCRLGFAVEFLASPAVMLHVWGVAGEKVATIAVQELGDVLSLKRRLHKLCGLPRFRQRLLQSGTALQDETSPDTDLEVQLLLLPFQDIPQRDVDTFISAAADGEVARLEEMLQLPIDPNLEASFGERPLMRAAWEGHGAVVELLLEAEADVDFPVGIGPRGWTALMSASNNGHAGVVRLLLEARASIDMVGSDCTALSAACEHGLVEVVRLLLEARADTDVATAQGCSALSLASGQGHAEVVSMLLQERANTDIADFSGMTALIRAADIGECQIVEFLLRARANTDAADKDGDTALFCAAAKGHEEVVSSLLEARADRDVANNPGATPLSRALDRGHSEIVALLEAPS